MMNTTAVKRSETWNRIWEAVQKHFIKHMPATQDRETGEWIPDREVRLDDRPVDHCIDLDFAEMFLDLGDDLGFEVSTEIGQKLLDLFYEGATWEQLMPILHKEWVES